MGPTMGSRVLGPHSWLASLVLLAADLRASHTRAAIGAAKSALQSKVFDSWGQVTTDTIQGVPGCTSAPSAAGRHAWRRDTGIGHSGWQAAACCVTGPTRPGPRSLSPERRIVTDGAQA